jgi:hypothetical protein
MIEARHRFRFATKTGKRFLGIGLKTQHPFQGDDAARMSLTRAINDAHATASDFFKNLIVTDPPISIAYLDFVE